MNRRTSSALIAAALIAGALVTAATDSNTKYRQVQNKRGRVRAEPDYLAPIVSELVYGDSLEVVKQDGGWVEGKLVASTRPGVPTDVSGWMHQSDLTEQKLTLNARDITPVERDEQVGHSAGGKGLGSATERKLLSMNLGITPQHFAWVDSMESRAAGVSFEGLREFLVEGGLAAGSASGGEDTP